MSWEKIERMRFILCSVNSDCANTGETVVPITADNAEYYEEMLSNLDYSKQDIEIFVAWIKTQR